jgi:putative transposase
MRRRGLPDPLLVISDGAPGLSARRGNAVSPTSCAICRARCPRINGRSPRRAIACYQAASPALAHMLRDEIAATYGAALPSAVACLQDDFEACTAHLRFPLAHRRAIRTTNLLERLFGEERRRTKVIPHAFGERAVLKLMYAELIRAAERWRGLCMTEFERRQLTATRNELDRAHAERTAPFTAPQTRLSRKART